MSEQALNKSCGTCAVIESGHYCSDWTPDTRDFDKLAEVARDMYQFITLCRDLPAKPADGAGELYKQRLNDCGVEI